MHRSNSKRGHHDYQPRDECLVIDHDTTKIEPRKLSPFNDTGVTIPRDLHTTEHLNIRHLVPFYR
jgi:hypothetical protein